MLLPDVKRSELALEASPPPAEETEARARPGRGGGPGTTKARLTRARRPVEFVVETLIKTVALVSIAAILLILVFIGKEALPVWTSHEISEEVGPLFAAVESDGKSVTAWQPVSEIPKHNVWPLIVGSLKVTLVAMLFAAPLSIAAAVYVAELAPKRLREVVKPVLELLAGVPSVVIGFFALVVLASVVQSVFGAEHRLNSIVAGIGLAFAIAPIVFTVSEDALRAVPQGLRVAADALGASRTQTVLRVVLPAAVPGIGAALVLGFGRAIGETMVVLLASGNAALLSPELGVSARTITATIAQELGETVVGSAHYHVLFALGVMLFLVTLGLNLLGQWAIARARRRLTGSP